MSVLRYLIFFFIFHYAIINPADSNCPKSFECGPYFGTLEFPFKNRKDCGGLFMVENCGTAGYPFIQFGDGVTRYIILQIQANILIIIDLFLSEYKKTNSCSSLSLRNVSLPDQSPFTTFKLVSPLNITVFTCQNQSPLDDYFENYSRTDCSPSWDLYYRNPETSPNIPLPPHHHIPSECSVSHVPMKPASNQNSSPGQFLDLLSDEYVIEWVVTDECYTCHNNGGECRTNSLNAFHCYRGKRKFRNTLLIGGGVTMAALTFTVIIVYLSIRKNYTLLKVLGILKSEIGKELDIELFLKDHRELAPKRYKYSDLKKMTKSFGENLGKGGYGSVYKGSLPDGRLVAVKILEESKGNGEEFINEVASISRTSHINVVTLSGFCFEDSKRALIYDFMPNGSLEKYIQNNVSSSSSSSEEEGGLGWEKLFEIALGIARGLDYLHQGCNMRILHFDIKPHNILLDKDFNPKISDFGLAKLCPNRSSIVSIMVARGTIGYIAPEVFSSNFGDVSYKSDVYSYGMMVLEIAGEKKKVDRRDVDRTSEMYFPEYIYKQLELMDDHGIVMNEDGSELAKRKLITVGLWCIQTHPKDRPSMSKVVDMLEGKIETLQVPPKPYLSSPPRSAQIFSTTSQST